MFLTQANFSLLFPYAPLASKATQDAIVTLKGSFLLEVGVGYTLNLLAIFVPVRLLLDYHLRARARLDRRILSLQDFGISSSWKEDLQNILAIAAPVLSVPAIQALGKF